MRNFLIIVLAIIVFPGRLLSQIFPNEGARLHYRLVPFVVPEIKLTNKYKIEIALGNHNTNEGFDKSIIRTVSISNARSLIEVPAFGSEYTWRIVNGTSRSGGSKSELHHFCTSVLPVVDSNRNRLRITQSAETYKNAYVFIDFTGVLYNMKGEPVWFLPLIDEKKMAPRDLKMTPQGTITFLDAVKAYEINYNGDILWKGPDNDIDSIACYHHEFTRLDNGHYMVLGRDVAWIEVSLADTTIPIGPFTVRRDKDNKLWQKVDFGSIIEYDSKGKLIWSWNSSNYFLKSDIMAHRLPNGIFDVDVHENAFYFDPAAKVIYLSCKNISRVLKIKYPSGEILNEYGNKYKPDARDMTNDLFCLQHNCARTQSGYLTVFNNNDCAPGLPKLIVMKEPKTKNGKLEKVWEFECNVSEDRNAIKNKRPMPGGNLIELPDHSFLATVNSGFTAVFIVGQNKKVNWCAIPELFSEDKKKWLPKQTYRSSIITKPADLERLIWNSIPPLK